MDVAPCNTVRWPPTRSTIQRYYGSNQELYDLKHTINSFEARLETIQKKIKNIRKPSNERLKNVMMNYATLLS